ncbi:DUF1642 domain-containing protein [Streptococcus sp. ZJ93]|uniref:DUF1642 domain-containing protein n=1 Tax=Streptococcus handemini TaxID=3161188 RepID=UPI0034D67B4D
MNKQEAIKRIEVMGEYEHFVDEPISKKGVLNIVRQIDELQKPIVPQVAADYYEQYKDKISGFDEWFSYFYSSDFENDFDKAEKLQIWLYDNDDKTNSQRELALATLIVNGLDAVEVEQEKKYRVELDNGQPLCSGDSCLFFSTDLCDSRAGIFTKKELEEAGFGWVFACDGVEVEEVKRVENGEEW